MLKMSAFNVKTDRQTTPPLVDGVVVHKVHYRVFVQWTCCSQSLQEVLHTMLAPLLVWKFLN